MEETLLTNSYFYNLPESLIANKPAEPRDSSKLMSVNRSNDSIKHQKFNEIVDYFKDGDLLVLNNTRVIPARLFGKKNFDGANIEVFLLKDLGSNRWLSMAKPAKRLKLNTVIGFKNNLIGKVLKILETGERVLEFSHESENVKEIINEIGVMPLPPYIINPECDPERYQTIYSKDEGSVAAPTAGLHFTDKLFEKLIDKGVKIEYITLHIGQGTFKPVKTENIKDHKMHSEYYEISKETAEILNEKMKNNQRIIAVGTTVVRTLESAFNKYNSFQECCEDTNIFIYPGYKFKVISALITNFHLPNSTLLMLVSAFWDRKKVLNAYNKAVENKYHFYSLGDSMFIH